MKQEAILQYVQQLPIEEAGVVIVDLDQLAENFHNYRDFLHPSICAMVIKSDAYGMGMLPVARTLHDAGCNDFFVASLKEAIQLRAALSDVHIYVIAGFYKGTECAFYEHKLIPCLNSIEQVERWIAFQDSVSDALPGVLHFDTGMNRTGIPEHEIEWLIENAALLRQQPLKYLMSHLSCGEFSGHSENARQYASLQRLSSVFPHIPQTLAATTIVNLDMRYKLHMTRIGYGVFGYKPTQQPLVKPALHIYGRVIQVKDVPGGAPVGYGAEYKTEKATRLATVNVGYGDGYERYFNLHGGHVAFNGEKAPIVGRISMDFIVVDIGHLNHLNIHENSWAELAGPHISISELIPTKGFVPHDIPISLGRRLKRAYIKNKNIWHD